MSIWSILGGFVGLYLTPKDMSAISAHGFLGGYTAVVWVVVVMQGATGICVALVMKYADNIVKNFSVAFATVIATIASIPLFEIWPTQYFVIGMSLVFSSMYIYSTSGIPKPPPPSISTTEQEPLVFTKDDRKCSPGKVETVGLADINDIECGNVEDENSDKES